MESESEKVVQLCLTLCDPMHYIVLGILQARILEWAAFPFSRGSSKARDQTQVSCIAGRFFTSWAKREAHELLFCFLEWKLFAVADTSRVDCYSLVTWPCLQGGHPDGNSLYVVQRRLAGIPPPPPIWETSAFWRLPDSVKLLRAHLGLTTAYFNTY